MTASNDIGDEGGYWQGTEKRQNVSLGASVLRQSVVRIHSGHPDSLKKMQAKFPNESSHDLVRFLQARGFDVDKAAAMYTSHALWKKETLPIPFESVRDTLSTRKFYVLDDKDQDGRPILFVSLRRFKEQPYVVEDEIKALVYVLEEQVKPKMGQSFESQKWTVLIDVSGIRSPPLQFLQKMNDVMEANYPERLFRTVMLPVPYWLQRIIQGCLSFVAKETRNKLAYVNDTASLEKCAMLSQDKLGPDIADLLKTAQLSKK